jgi:hypothetical protein
MHTAGTALVAGGEIISFKTDHTVLRGSGRASAGGCRSERDVNPMVPVEKRWTTSSSPSVAKRFGTDINE